MSWYTLLQPDHVYTFLLLFVRLSTLFVFLPFFNHMSVSPQIKAALAFYLTLALFPLMPTTPAPATWSPFVAALFSEIVLGLIAGVALNIVFGIFAYAGEQIAFVMGFSLASVMDPQSQIQSPLVSQFLTMTALLVLLAFDGHHLMLLWMVHALESAPLGGLVMSHEMFDYIVRAMGNLFMVGFSVAFPIVALSLLSDIIFGMLMKTMPQFNLLVVGFPIKIALSLAVWAVVLGAMMGIFKEEFLAGMRVLGEWVGGP
ncbi:flagellar biosynthetic protein FliR [Hydrogenimonas sp.]